MPTIIPPLNAIFKRERALHLTSYHSRPYGYTGKFPLVQLKRYFKTRLVKTLLVSAGCPIYILEGCTGELGPPGGVLDRYYDPFLHGATTAGRIEQLSASLCWGRGSLNTIAPS